MMVVARFYYALLAVVALLAVIAPAAVGGLDVSRAHEHRLRERLFASYNPGAQPRNPDGDANEGGNEHEFFRVGD